MSYITPTAPLSIDEDGGLANTLQEMVVGMVGFTDPTRVRPRWQQIPALEPPSDVDWASVGTTISPQDANSYQEQINDTTFHVQRHVVYEVLITFYGPNAMTNVGRCREGLGLPQNWWALNQLGFAFIDMVDVIIAPSDLVGQEWRSWVDLRIRVGRQVDRYYTSPSVVNKTTPTIIGY